MILRLLLTFYLCFVNSSVLAAYDRELIESAKCSRLFSYFEKKSLIPLDALYSISLQESGKPHSKHNIKIVWPWSVNVEGKSYIFDNKKEAVIFVYKQMKAGVQSIDVGCMQINLKYHPNAFSSIEQALDPKHNIAYAARFLKSNFIKSGNWHQAIAQYHSTTNAFGYKYKDKVINIAENMRRYKYLLRACYIMSNNTSYSNIPVKYAKFQRYNNKFYSK